MADLALTWELLFQEKYDVGPNPNLPENLARVNALRNEKKEALRRLKDGPGKPMFEMFDRKIKEKVMALLQDPRYRQCNCPATNLIIEIGTLVSLWIEAEQAIRQEEK